MPPAANEFCGRSHCPVPPPPPDQRRDLPCHSRAAAAAAHPPGSDHTRAGGRSPRTKPSPHHRRDISRGVPSDQGVSVQREHRRRTRKMHSREWHGPALAYSLLHSGIHAAKSGVHILVMRLKPVAEARSQHASGRARRSAVHHEMFAIKEVGRVTTVERKWLEAGEWTKNRGCPFPTVAEKALHSESALAESMPIHGSRIPMCEVEVPQARIGSIPTPGVASLRAIRTSICRP